MSTKIKIRSGRLSVSKVMVAICTMGISIPFTGLRRGGVTVIEGMPGR
jgi:hypothetical protein